VPTLHARFIGRAVQNRRRRTVAQCKPTPLCRAQIRPRSRRRTSSQHHRQVGVCDAAILQAMPRVDSSGESHVGRISLWTAPCSVRSAKRLHGPSGYHLGAFARGPVRTSVHSAVRPRSAIRSIRTHRCPRYTHDSSAVRCRIGGAGPSRSANRRLCAELKSALAVGAEPARSITDRSAFATQPSCKRCRA
jgi:hypothetical protein